MSLDLFVSDERGSVYFHKSDVNMVKFSFQTGSFQQHTMKPYSFCVINQVHKDSRSNPGAIRRVTLEVEVENQDNRKTEASRLAKQSHAEKVYTDFLSVSSDVDRLIEKMDDLREKEKALSELNEQTATTILRISVIACLFTIGTGVLNFLSLKTFFKRKKLA